MSDYSSLKATINANVKANNNHEITGSIMNSVLNAMVNSLGAGYQYIGVATPTNPGSAQTPDYKCFYIATTPGTYTNLGGLVVSDGEVALLKWDTAWTKEVTGIASADQLNQLGQQVIYDVSANNGGITFTSLSALLSSENLSTLIPTTVRCGGMSIRFVQSFDNKYVQFRCIADEFTTDTTQWVIANEGVYVENPEFIEAKIDSEGKILEGIQHDGTKVISGDLNVGGTAKILGEMEVAGVTYKVIENPEYLAAWVDAEDKVIFGLKTDGKTYVGDADFLNDIEDIKAFIQNTTDKNIDWDAISSITAVENPEFIEAKIDSEGKLLAGRTTDGAAFEKVGISTSKLKVAGTDITDNVEAINCNTAIYDAEERVEIITDNDGKIISYRNSDGILVEKVGIIANDIKVDNLEYSKNVTSKEYIYTEKPKYAELYVTGNLPTDISEDRIPTRVILEFKKSDTTLFKCNADMSIQGHGSLWFPKHNFTLDLLNSNNDELSVKFGDIVAVDSFHLKGYYSDETQVRSLGSAALWREMVKYLDYPYSKVQNIPYNTVYNNKADSLFIADAKFSEDGFPCGVYVNNEFYGLFTLKVKKPRQNYAMQKDVKQEIFLDSLGGDERREEGGEIHHANFSYPFDYASWEVKNPKMKNYEGGGEIPDAEVLANIERLFNFTNNIDTMYQDYADYIVLPHWVLWVILNELVVNWDIEDGNYEVCTWDGTHWSILPYDMDVALQFTDSRSVTNIPFFSTFKSLFINDIKTIYTKLRKMGIIESGYVYSLYTTRINNVPRDIFKADMDKWSSYLDEEKRYINFLYESISKRIEYLDSIWLIA